MLRSPLDPASASNLEHLLSPGKIEMLTCRASSSPSSQIYALDLFDEDLAKQRLYGAEAELALNPESVYYRSARIGCRNALVGSCGMSAKRQVPENDDHSACSRVAEVAWANLSLV